MTLNSVDTKDRSPRSCYSNSEVNYVNILVSRIISCHLYIIYDSETVSIQCLLFLIYKNFYFFKKISGAIHDNN